MARRSTPSRRPSSFTSGDDLMKGYEVGKVFEVSDFSFGVEQVLNIGSTTGGAGAGQA